MGKWMVELNHGGYTCCIVCLPIKIHPQQTEWSKIKLYGHNLYSFVLQIAHSRDIATHHDRPTIPSAQPQPHPLSPPAQPHPLPPLQLYAVHHHNHSTTSTSPQQHPFSHYHHHHYQSPSPPTEHSKLITHLGIELATPEVVIVTEHHPVDGFSGAHIVHEVPPPQVHRDLTCRSHR